jgi:hypothetical protein
MHGACAGLHRRDAGSTLPVVMTESPGGDMRMGWGRVLLLASCLCACAQAPEPSRPQRAGQPLDPVETTARIVAANAASAVGDADTARAQTDAVADDLRRAMKLPDGSRPIDPEAARTVVRRVPGVRSVAWVDRTHLLAIVATNEARSQTTIDAICLALEPLGDTLGVVVHLQSAAARNGDELELLDRNCQLAPGDRAMLQSDRRIDTVSPEVRAIVKAQRAEARDDAATRRRDEETRRVLEAGTPQM